MAEHTDDLVTELERRLLPAARRALGSTQRELPSVGDALDAAGSSSRPAIDVCLLAVGPLLLVFVPLAANASLRASLGSGVGNVAVALALVGAAFAWPLVRIAERARDRARVAVGAAAVSSATLLATAMAAPGAIGAIPVVAAACVLTAVATGVSLLVDSFPPSVRIRVVSLYVGAVVAVSGCAQLLVAATTGHGWTWRGAFAAAGALGTIATLAAVRARDPGLGRADHDTIAALAEDASGGRGTETTGSMTLRLTHGERFRRAAAAPSARAAVLAMAALGALLLPVRDDVLELLRDRYGFDPSSGLALVFVAVAVSLVPLVPLARRGELAFSVHPARAFHFVAWSLALGAGLLAFGAVVGNLALLTVAFAGSVAAITGAAAIGAVLVLVVCDRAHRFHAGVLLGTALAFGALAGDLVATSIGSRYGVAWSLQAVAAAVALSAARVSVAMRTAAADLDVAASATIEEHVVQTLASQGRHVPLLACRRVDFSYGQLQVLFGVDFSVDAGEMVALLGTNGAGKSTLLRVISGLGLPQRGSVRFRGNDITYLGPDARVQLGIAQVPGGKAVFGSMSVIDNLRAYGHSVHHDRARLDAGIDAALDAFPRLAERRDQLASSLSGGEQQMLALGKAFILRPELLLVDELSLGLAPVIVGELLEFVKRINERGTAVVLIEQSVNIALNLVDHAYFMEKGQIRYDGPARELLDRPDLVRSVFLEGATVATRGTR